MGDVDDQRHALLEVRNVSFNKAPGQPVFTKVSFDVNKGDTVVLQGKSGSGKTTLLKCIAHLNVYEGDVLYRGLTPKSYGVPSYRTRIFYVPQRPALLAGTPRDFLTTISSFKSRKTQLQADKNALNNPIQTAKNWGVEEELWDRNWSDLSGGESQRVALAVAVGLNTAEILLLDEPTSALDANSMNSVEQTIMDEMRSDGQLKAIIWITHSEEQSRRVGTRFFRITPSGVEEDLVPNA